MRRADGRIRPLGRVADVINIGGGKVRVAPIEQQIQKILEVENVCLFNQLDDGGKDVLAIAYEAELAAPRHKMEQVARQFPALGQIRFVRFDAFPRTGTLQKIDRPELRRALFGRAKE